MPKQRVTLKKLWNAIRKNCVTCMGNQPGLVEGCDSQSCALYPYRFGPNSRKGDLGVGLLTLRRQLTDQEGEEK